MQPKPTPEPFDELSDRELEVARLLVRGLSCHEIADELGISKKTVDTHRGNVMRKTGVKNVVVLTRVAVASGFVRLGPLIIQYNDGKETYDVADRSEQGEEDFS